MTLLKSIKSSQLNSGQKNKLSKLQKSQQLTMGKKIFEEIFKKGNILPLLAGYLLRGYEKPLYLTTEWPSEWDMILRWYEQGNAAEKAGADIQKRHSGRTAKAEPNWHKSDVTKDYWAKMTSQFSYVQRARVVPPLQLHYGRTWFWRPPLTSSQKESA